MLRISRILPTNKIFGVSQHKNHSTQRKLSEILKKDLHVIICTVTCIEVAIRLPFSSAFLKKDFLKDNLFTFFSPNDFVLKSISFHVKKKTKQKNVCP